MKIKIKKLSQHAHLPTYANKGDAGMDLWVPDDFENKIIWPGELVMVDHMISMEIPDGHFGLIRPRSGLASKHGLDVCTSGVIDSGYRGSVKTCFANHSNDPFEILAGTRVAQMVIIPIPSIELIEVDKLSDSIRGKGGHGSTGV